MGAIQRAPCNPFLASFSGWGNSMIPLKNVRIWTSRSAAYSATTGTPAPSPHLSAIEAHQSPVPQSDYISLPAGAMESEDLIKVEAGTDIKKGDTITKVGLNDPPAYTPWDELGSNETLVIAFARNSSAGALQHRGLYCQRVTGGGPSI